MIAFWGFKVKCTTSCNVMLLQCPLCGFKTKKATEALLLRIAVVCFLPQLYETVCVGTVLVAQMQHHQRKVSGQVSMALGLQHPGTASRHPSPVGRTPQHPREEAARIWHPEFTCDRLSSYGFWTGTFARAPWPLHILKRALLKSFLAQ